MMHEDFFAAIKAGDVKLVKGLLSDNPALVEAQTDWGGNPLHVAAEAGHLELLKLLITHKIDVNARDDKGETPLFYGVENPDFEEIVLLLLEHHADVNAANKIGQTIMHKLVADGTDEKQINFLVNLETNINQKSDAGVTPLHLAAMRGSAASVRFLVENGAEVNTVDIKGYTPLHFAVYGNIMRHQIDFYLKTAEQLILLGADISAKTHDGHTPLDLARRHVGYPIADMLISHGAK